MAERAVGLALGSGARRGYAIIPIINKLKKENISIVAVSGSSVGGLMGAYYALHGEVDSLLAIIKKTSKRDWLKLIDPNDPRKSLVKGEKIRQFMIENFFGDKTFSDTKIPLVICATDFIRQKSMYITKGKIVDAVMASICIPGLLPPYSLNGRLYIDGGILDPMPTKPLLDMGLAKVVGVNLMRYTYSKEKQSFGIIPALLDTIYMMMERMATRKASNRLYMLEPVFKPEGSKMLNLYNWKPTYEIGQKLINRKIGELKRWLDS